MSLRIVACDDEAHITRAISMKLTKAGFDVVTASDGQMGWELIQQEKPSLVISDLQMPRMDGLSLCRMIRSTPETAEIPFILLTAKGFGLDQDELISELKLSALAVKPFSPRELLKLVQETLGVTASLN